MANQHQSRKGSILSMLRAARGYLSGPAQHRHHAADLLSVARGMIRDTPDSSRRRWKCGR